MSRRAKLSLVTGKETTKKQAPGFELTPPQTEPAPAQTGHAPRSTVLEPPGSTGAASARKEKVAEAQPAAWPSGRQLVKIVVVVVATALSLYLLKRRFF